MPHPPPRRLSFSRFAQVSRRLFEELAQERRGCPGPAWRGFFLDWVKSRSRSQKRIIFVTLDLALVPLALFFTLLMLSPSVDLAFTMSVMGRHVVPLLPYLLAAAGALSLWFGVPQIRLQHFELQAMGRIARFAATLAAVAFALNWATGGLQGLGVHVIFGLSFFLGMTLCRVLLRNLLIALYRARAPRRRVLIYGAGTTGGQLAQALRNDNRVTLVGFADDNVTLHGLLIAGLPVYSPAKLQGIVKDQRIDKILLAIPSLSKPKQLQIARRLQPMGRASNADSDTGIEVQALLSFSQLIGSEDILDTLTPLEASLGASLEDQSFLGRHEVTPPVSEAAECYAGKAVLISGAGGTIGTELCHQILACRPAKIVLYELSEYALYTVHTDLGALAAEHGVTLVPVLGSVTDPRQVRQALNEHAVDIVLHAAAYKHVPLMEANPLPGITNNVLGTHILAREAREAGVARFILVSSDKAVRPSSVMGASKRLAELIVQDLANRTQSRPAGDQETIYSTVRFGNVLGSSGSVLPLFREQIRRGGPVTVTHPDVMRYFMTVTEAARLVLISGAMAAGGEVFVLDMGKPVRIIDLARDAITRSGYSVKDADAPDGDIPIDIIGLRPGEKLEEELTVTGDHRATRHPKIFCAREDCLSEIEMARALRALREALSQGDIATARRLITDYVEVHESFGAPAAGSPWEPPALPGHGAILGRAHS